MTDVMPAFTAPTPDNELADVAYLHQREPTTEHQRTQRLPRVARAFTLQWIPILR